MTQKNDAKPVLAKLTKNELVASGQQLFTQKQLNLIIQKTPEKYIEQRPGKGGGQWSYVKGSYVKKMLNLVFGFDWNFEIVKHEFDLNIGQAYVLGRLTVRVGENRIKIKKEQFGRVDIKFKTKPKVDADGNPVTATNYKGVTYQVRETTNEPLDIGNDLKASATDALKKCASELGFFQDVYTPEYFIETEIVDHDEKMLIKEKRKTDRLKMFLDKADTPDKVDEIERQFLNGNGGLISDEQKELINNKYNSFI